MQASFTQDDYAQIDSTAIEIELPRVFGFFRFAVDGGAATGTVTVTYKPPGFTNAQAFDPNTLTIVDNKPITNDLPVTAKTIILTPATVSTPVNWRLDCSDKPFDSVVS